MIQELKEKFLQQYAKQAEYIVRSPGRVNIIGEHIDYNDGLVLPGAIDNAVYMAVAKRNDNKIQINSIDFEENYVGNVQNIERSNKKWPNYLLGVFCELQKINLMPGGVDIMLSSDIPIGAGLSSSAAIGCATIFALNELFKFQISKLKMIELAQKSEHHFVGVMCGIMDQFTNMFGKKEHVIILDCRSLEYEYVPLNLKDYAIVLFNTNVKHALISSEFNDRWRECIQGITMVKKTYPEVRKLRDVTQEMLDATVLPFDKLIYKRCSFVVQEMKRLQLAIQDVKEGNIKALGKRMFESHDGLSKEYNVSCKELDFLIDAVRNNEAVAGAKLMGAGFGGCTINIIKQDAIEKIVEPLKIIYQKEMNLPLTTHLVTIEEGTSLV